MIAKQGTVAGTAESSRLNYKEEAESAMGLA